MGEVDALVDGTGCPHMTHLLLCRLEFLREFTGSKI